MNTAPPPVPLDDVRAEVVRACRTAAPMDLARRPVYLSFTSELPHPLAGGTFGACTSLDMDELLRPHLRQPWDGRGFGMIIDDSPASVPPNAELFVRACVALALHEAAHEIERGHGAARTEPATIAELSHLAELFRLDAEGGPPPVERLDVHGPRWIRCAIHLSHRAAEAGIRFFRPAVMDPTHYGLSSAFTYEMALGDEPIRLAGLSLAEVLRCPPPPAFVRLWAEDLASLRGHQEPEAEKSAA